jgi:hypothetical protein
MQNSINYFTPILGSYENLKLRPLGYLASFAMDFGQCAYRMRRGNLPSHKINLDYEPVRIQDLKSKVINVIKAVGWISLLAASTQHAAFLTIPGIVFIANAMFRHYNQFAVIDETALLNKKIDDLTKFKKNAEDNSKKLNTVLDEIKNKKKSFINYTSLLKKENESLKLKIDEKQENLNNRKNEIKEQLKINLISKQKIKNRVIEAFKQETGIKEKFDDYKLQLLDLEKNQSDELVELDNLRKKALLKQVQNEGFVESDNLHDVVLKETNQFDDILTKQVNFIMKKCLIGFGELKNKISEKPSWTDLCAYLKKLNKDVEDLINVYKDDPCRAIEDFENLVELRKKSRSAVMTLQILSRKNPYDSKIKNKIDNIVTKTNEITLKLKALNIMVANFKTVDITLLRNKKKTIPSIIDSYTKNKSYFIELKISDMMIDVLDPLSLKDLKENMLLLNNKESESFVKEINNMLDATDLEKIIDGFRGLKTQLKLNEFLEKFNNEDSDLQIKILQTLTGNHSCWLQDNENIHIKAEYLNSGTYKKVYQAIKINDFTRTHVFFEFPETALQQIKEEMLAQELVKDIDGMMPPMIYRIEKNICYAIQTKRSEGTLLLKKQFSASMILNIFQRMANAIAGLHEKNICHCDIKPDNFLLDDQWNPYLSDFGTVVELDKNGEGEMKSCTVAYLEPECKYEQREKVLLHKVTKAMDLFALGVTFFKILTNQVHIANQSSINHENSDYETDRMLSINIRNNLESLDKIVISLEEKINIKYEKNLDKIILKKIFAVTKKLLSINGFNRISAENTYNELNQLLSSYNKYRKK